MGYIIFCLIGCVIFGYIGYKVAKKENNVEKALKNKQKEED